MTRSPGFVGETSDTIYMLRSPETHGTFRDPIVVAKKEAAVKWCADASDHAASYRRQAVALCADSA